MESICTVTNLSFFYNPSKMILDDISFTIHNNEIVGILGKNGSGKTTLLNLMTGFLKDYSGKININQKNVKDYSINKRAKSISYIQQSKLTIPDYYIVADYILEGRRPFRPFGFYKKEDYLLLDDIIVQCNLENLKFRHLKGLSGGELQRCRFARALMKQCDFFVFDEPTSAMDIKYQKEFFELAKLAKKQLNAGIMLSIHDINLAIKYCDRLIVLSSGKILYNGGAKNVTKEILSKAFDIDVSDTCQDKVHFYY